MARIRIGYDETGKWGFVDKKGKEVVKPKYGEVNDFRNGLAQVWIDGKWGFIDKNGKEIVKPKYDAASDFSEGIAPVSLGDNWYIINKKGKVLRKL